MHTQDTLAQLLQGVNVEDVAREAQVSAKTIYRLRHKANAPTLRTLERIVQAVERVKQREKVAA